MEKAREFAALARSEPSFTQLQNLASEFSQNSHFQGKPVPETLEVYSAILQARLILVFENDASATETFVKLFSTPAGLGCLISHLRGCSQREVPRIIYLLEKILTNESIVPHFLDLAPLESTNLFFGSRILASVSAKPIEHSWIGDASSYSRWLAKQMIRKQSRDPRLFEKGVKLGAPKSYLQEYTLDLPLLESIFKQFRQSQQRVIVAHALLPLLPKIPSQSSRVLFQLGVNADLFVDICLRLPASVPVIRAAVVLAREQGELTQLITKVGEDWASSVSIEGKPLAQQQAMTQFLIAASASLDTKDAVQFVHSPTITNGVANHLTSTSAIIRNLGTLVGEVFAKQAGAKLEFGIEYSEYPWWLGVDSMDSEFSFEESSTREEKTEPAPKLANLLLRPARASSAVDSDDEEEEEEEEEEQEDERRVYDDEESDEEVTPLFYVKDLISYLRSDKYGEVHCALTTGASLITRKTDFGTEVSQYSEELLHSACSLTDKYNMTDFAELRQSIINAVVMADPTHAAPQVVQMFAAGDWSLAQRQSLLASLVYAAHTLAHGGREEKHEQLPDVLHKLFVSPKDAIYLKTLRPSATPQQSAGEGSPRIAELENNNRANSTVSGVVTTRRSKKLDQVTSLPKNLFSDISDKFFYPLFAASPPLRPSSYDAVIFAQWLRTLGVLIVESYPSRHLPDMASELWILLKKLTTSMDRREVIIREAIYSCYAMLSSVAGGIIVNQYPADIGALFDAIALSCSKEPTPSAQETGRAAMGALAQLAQQVEQRLLNPLHS